jgi:hypothetical protein
MVAPPEDDELGRGRMTNTRRIELLERDRAQQSRVITELIDKVGRGFTDQQMAQIREAMREELADAGLRLDGADHQDEARRDFMFLRAFRRATNGAAAKIGWLVIAAFAGGIIWLVNAGLNVWRAGGG